MKRIVLIEDDPLYLTRIKLELETMYPDYVIDAYENASFGLSTIDDSVIAVITDFYLGDLTGLNVINYVKGVNKDIEVIVLSGSFTMEIRKDCYRADCMDFIHKDEDFTSSGFFKLKKDMDLIVSLDKKVSALEARIVALEKRGIKPQ